MKIWSLPIHENLTTDGKYCRKKGAISPLFHNIFNISLTSKVQLPISLLNVVNQIFFSSILQTWYVELRISRSISESPLEFEITRVDCTIYVLAVMVPNITNTYNVDPLQPHFYIAKLGFTGVYINFLISAQKHRLWVLVRTASPRRF